VGARYKASRNRSYSERTLCGAKIKIVKNAFKTKQCFERTTVVETSVGKSRPGCETVFKLNNRQLFVFLSSSLCCGGRCEGVMRPPMMAF